MLISNMSNNHYHHDFELLVTIHVSWGWQKPLLRTAFHTLVCSKIDYAAPAWQPWLSNTSITSLDHLQNQALRLITEQLVSTPIKALCLESDVQSYYTISKHLIVWARNNLLYKTTFLNTLPPAPASAVKLLNFCPSFQRNSVITKLSICSHLLHG